MNDRKPPRVELHDGETVWAAWASVASGGEARAYCDPATVIMASAGIVQKEGRQPRTIEFFEGTFRTEAEARAYLAEELAGIRDRLQAVINEQATLAAASRVGYA